MWRGLLSTTDYTDYSDEPKFLPGCPWFVGVWPYFLAKLVPAASLAEKRNYLHRGEHRVKPVFALLPKKRPRPFVVIIAAIQVYSYALGTLGFLAVSLKTMAAGKACQSQAGLPAGR